MFRPLKQPSALQKEGLKIAKLLRKGGFEAFWVGGTVRDMVLKRQSDNLDMATSATPDQTEAVLKRGGYVSKPVGKTYGTILAVTKHGPVEVTTFRREGRYADRRRPQELSYVDDYRIDAKRRDFTINALYLDPLTGEMHDPQGGMKDVNGRLLKFVGDARKRIDEDALRMLRAARLSTQLDFKLEKRSFAAIKTRAKYIQSISGERIKAELDKILSHPNKASGIRLLDDLGLLRFIMPEVVDLKQTWHKSRMYHLEGSVFEHALLVLENTKSSDPTLGYAALYHDAGKATTAVPRRKPEGLVNSFPKHEFVSADMAKKLTNRLPFNRVESQKLLWITKMHMARISFIRDMVADKKIALASHKFFPNLLELWRADSLGNIRIENGQRLPGKPVAYKEGLKLLANINANKKLATKLSSGQLIMRVTKMKSGPRIGEIKRRIEEQVFLGQIKNISELKKFLQRFTKNT